jgi:hypothetical protein
VARLHAARGESKTALAELKRARTLGFNDSARVAREPEWNALRDDPKFAEIVSAIQGT